MKTVLLFVGMVSFTVIANVFLKLGATSGQPAGHSLTHLLNWRVILGLLSFALAAGFYILILEWLPLNVAVSFAAAQYIAVILASAVILSEPVGFTQWIGIAFISIGIAVIGWSQR